MEQLHTHTRFWACRSIYLRTHSSIDLSTFVVVWTYPIALFVQLSSVHKAFAQGWPKTQPAGNPSEVPVTSHSSWAVWAWTLTWPWLGHRSWTLWNPGSWSVWRVWIKVLSLNRRSSCQDLKLFACQSFSWQTRVSGFSAEMLEFKPRAPLFYGIWNWDFATDPGRRISLPRSKSKSVADFELWCPRCCSSLTKLKIGDVMAKMQACLCFLGAWKSSFKHFDESELTGVSISSEGHPIVWLIYLMTFWQWIDIAGKVTWRAAELL